MCRRRWWRPPRWTTCAGPSTSTMRTSCPGVARQLLPAQLRRHPRLPRVPDHHRRRDEPGGRSCGAPAWTGLKIRSKAGRWRERWRVIQA
ncbi:hypothetical protein SETIT_7G300600v2 [Setaria italica]|uniref:Uncharacterized protein n=1 Tax=Setaria italica TaxID=4555 RepID=A0A368S1D9_SETIT|nr:hypothetical protein SETIT_7G300600v2 [Setaria italica]